MSFIQILLHGTVLCHLYRSCFTAQCCVVEVCWCSPLIMLLSTAVKSIRCRKPVNSSWSPASCRFLTRFAPHLIYLWHCDQVTSRRRLSEDSWRHFCLTVLKICYVRDSYRDIDSYVTILPSLPTYGRTFVALANLRYINVLNNNNKCKKLNSLKHLVRTTVAGSHN